MPTLNIKDPEVYLLAAELARRRGTSMTGAVRVALEEAIEHARADRTGMAEALLEIGRQAKAEAEAAGVVYLTDDDLYDEHGLPK